ncbi:hypothetical protein [Pantoea sp. R13S299]|uniref:hypothetical protein n=1 Tax=Pantoea sp. R13S299 TaxID=3402751 RepID=UPI003AED97BC
MGARVRCSPLLAHPTGGFCARMVAGGKPPAFQMQGEGGLIVQILTCIRMKIPKSRAFDMQQIKLTDEESEETPWLAVRKFLRDVTLLALFIVKHQR